MNISIRHLTPHELQGFRELLRPFAEVFETKNFRLPREQLPRNILNKKDFLVFVAKPEDKVIGGLTVYVLDPYYPEKPLAYIHDLAVATNHPRKGVGKKPIQRPVDYGGENNFEEISVQADKEDDHAPDFYRSTEIADESLVVHFSCSTIKAEKWN